MYIALRLLRDARTRRSRRASPGRGPQVRRDARQRRLAPPPARRRHRPARPRRGHRPRRRGRRARAAGHPDQQRRPDRPPLTGAYAHLAAAAQAPLPSGPLPRCSTLGRSETADRGERPLVADAAGAHRARADAGSARRNASPPGPRSTPAASCPTRTRTTAGAISSRGRSRRAARGPALNQIAPSILIGRLRAALEASAARRTYIVNVSAMEGQFAAATRAPATPTRTWPRPR